MVSTGEGIQEDAALPSQLRANDAPHHSPYAEAAEDQHEEAFRGFGQPSPAATLAL